MKHKAIAWIALTALAGCSTQMPSHVSQPEAFLIAESEATFTRCEVVTRFGGPPRKFTSIENAQFARQLTSLPKFAKWEVDGLAREEYRQVEAAVCLCADMQLTVDQISGLEHALRSGGHYQSVRKIEVPFSRISVETQSARDVNGVVTRIQFLTPKAAPSCIFAQSASFVATFPADATAFLGSTRPRTLR